MDNSGLKHHSEMVIAFLQGKTIEIRHSDGVWDVAIFPSWNINCTYRIAPEKLERTVWVNIYPEGNDDSWESSVLHSSKEKAERGAVFGRVACKSVTIEYFKGEGLD